MAAARGLRSRALRVLGYAAFTAAVFLVSLWQVFPYGALARRAEQALRRPELAVRIEGLGPGRFPGWAARRVRLEMGPGASTVLEFQDVRAAVPLMALVRGRGVVEFEGRTMGGTVRGTAQLPDARSVTAAVQGVDLSRVPLPEGAKDLALSGTLTGQLELAIDRSAPEQSSGRLESTLREVRVGEGKVGGIPVPAVHLGDGRVRAASEAGKLEVESIAFENGDLGVEFSGSVLLRADAARSLVNGMLSLQPNEKASQDLALLFAIFPGPRGSDGRYTARVRGSLAAPRLVTR